MKPIELKAGLCCERLMESADGQWWTNGHWMVRPHLVKRIKATPAIESYRPDTQTILKPIERGVKKYKPVEVSAVSINDARFLFDRRKNLRGWVGSQYAETFLELGTVWAIYSQTPIVVTAEDKCLSNILAVVMPVREPSLMPKDRDVLRQWLTSDCD